MRIKKIVLSMLMFMFFVATVASAANSGKLTITANKSSGKVSTAELITYTCTTDGDASLTKFESTIKDGSGNVISQYDTKNTKSNTNKFIVQIYTPSVPYEKISVEIVFADSNNKKATKTFNYTMDATQKFSVTTSPESGSTIAIGERILITSQAGLTGCGLKEVSYEMYDKDNNKMASNTLKPEDYGKGVGVAKSEWTINGPAKYSEKITLKVKLTDIRNNTFDKSFDFKMNVPTTTLSYAVCDSSDKTISDNANVGPSQPAYINVTSSNKSVGIRTFKIKITNTTSGRVYLDKEATSSKTGGANPLKYNFSFPNEEGKYKVELEATDVNGKKSTKVFYFTVKGDITVDMSNKLSITANVANNSELAAGSKVQFTSTSSNSSVGTKKMTVKIYDKKTGELIDTKVGNTSYENVGSNPMRYNIALNRPGTEYKIVINVIDVQGNTKEATFYYKTKGTPSSSDNDDKDFDDDKDNDDKDDNDDDDHIYKGVILKDGDDLAVDLWTKDKSKFFELDETIEFVAYYYNYESKDKKNVVLEVEIPDEFDIVSVTPDQGTVTKKVNGEYFKVSLGTVKSKKLGAVKFKLKATEDDACEEISTIKAIIYSDKDDEEDSSTQLVWIYEKNDKGTRKSFITGYKDGSFRPDNAITREEAAAMLARAFGYTATSTSRQFTDVKQTSWSYRYIAGCANKGIITGYTDGTFKPYKNITRAEIYAMTFRALDLSTDEKALIVPKEYKNDSSWETSYIAGLERLRMLEDMDDTAADEYATRAEVVYLISRVQFRNTSGFSVGTYFDVNSSYWCAKDIEAASVNYSYKRGAKGKEIISK